MAKYEFIGKTVSEAVEYGLKELGLTEDDVVVTVLEEGKRKLFGAVKARVEIETKDEAPATDSETEPAPATEATGKQTDGERALEFLKGLFDVMDIVADAKLVDEGEKIHIEVIARNNNEVIGKRGVVLDAVQTLASAVANIGRNDYKRVVVDCENYRENREETLKKLSENLAAKAVRLGRKIKLEPMNPYERRVIHSALGNSDEVKTVSEGKEPNRYVVIVPANDEYPDEEPIPARDEHRGGRGGRDRDKGGRKPYNGGGRKPYNGGSRDRGRGGRSGGKPKAMDFNFFGTFLGNSNDDKNE